MRWVVACGALFALTGVDAALAAATYRCTLDGKVTYSDLPCSAGTQTIVELADPRVPPADRATAEARARGDRAALAAIDRRKAIELAEDRRAAAIAARNGTDRSRQARACEKLARAARRAHDEFDLAGSLAQPKARLRMLRADQDFAALCKRPR